MNIKGWFTEHIPLKLVALFVALLLHLFLRGDREEVVGVFVPVTASVPRDQLLTSEPVPRVKLTVRGNRSSLQRLDEQGVPPLRIDLTDVKDGIFEFTPDLFRIPPGLSITAIQPPSMRVELDRRGDRVVQVVPQLIGEPAPGYRVLTRRVAPPRVTVSGPQRLLSEVSAVLTDPVDISGRTRTFTTSVTVRDNLRGRGTIAPQQVNITVEMEPIVEARALREIPLTVRGGADGLLIEVEPRQVSLSVQGPVVVLNEMEVKDIVAFVDARGLALKGTETRRQLPAPIQIEGVPALLTILKVEPDAATLNIAAPDPEPPTP